MPKGGKTAIAAKKAKENKSFGEKLKSGIRSLGSDIAMGIGAKDKTDDYIRRTANTVAVNRAIQRGDPSGLSDDLQSRYRREKMMADMSRGRDKRQRDTQQQTADQAPDMTDQYAENLRRYNEYMQSQQPQGPAVTPDMRRAALDVFESQRGAGQMPYYMAAAAQSQDPDMSPAFQYAAQNYATLGGSQRLGPRPMEMMSVAERRQINDMAQAMADQAAQQQAAQNQYQQGMDVVMRGGGKGGPAVMPQTGGQFNSMEELMDFQNKNPHMNLMGEYQRLKALEGGGATMPQTGGGMPRPPLPFASMLAQRFGSMY